MTMRLQTFDNLKCISWSFTNLQSASDIQTLQEAITQSGLSSLSRLVLITTTSFNMVCALGSSTLPSSLETVFLNLHSAKEFNNTTALLENDEAIASAVTNSVKTFRLNFASCFDDELPLENISALVRRFPSMTELDIITVRRALKDVNGILNAIANHLPRLRTLDLENTISTIHITDASATAAFLHLTALKSLSWSKSQSMLIHGNSLPTVFTRLTTLTHLDVNCYHIDTIEAHAENTLFMMTQLVSLSLDEITGLCDTFIQRLCNSLPALTNLSLGESLRRSPRTVLDTFTDNMLLCISSQLMHLKTLCISMQTSGSVTDEGIIMHLGQMTRLEQLRLSYQRADGIQGSKLTKKTRKGLRRLLHNTTVIFSCPLDKVEENRIRYLGGLLR